jgi:aryl carrier-like protein
VADFVELTKNMDQWWDSFNWLRREKSGGIRSIDSECGSVVDFVELTKNMDQWWDLTSSEYGSVAGFVELTQKVDQWCTLLN